MGDVPFNWYPAQPLSEMRIGYLKTEFEQQAGCGAKGDLPAGARRVETPAQTCSRSSCRSFRLAALRIILVAEAATAFDDITREWRINQAFRPGAGRLAQHVSQFAFYSGG